MRVLDLFSGIGGFSLGLERAGMETVAFCEYDKKAQLVLKKHWPEIPIYDDIRTLTGKQIAKDIGAIDLICGGFPCQGHSLAGKRKGKEDDRYLWPEYFRLIQEVRPDWVIGENVPGIITDLVLDQVLSDLESENYTWEAFIIPACALDAPHRRDRVWIVANTGSGGWGNSQPRIFGEDGERRLQEGIGSSKTIETTGPSEASRIAAYTNNAGRGERRGAESIQPKQPLAEHDSEIRPEGHWSVEPELGRVANGIPNRTHRLKQLGNAVVPQIVEVIGRAIMEINKQSTT